MTSPPQTMSVAQFPHTWRGATLKARSAYGRADTGPGMSGSPTPAARNVPPFTCREPSARRPPLLEECDVAGVAERRFLPLPKVCSGAAGQHEVGSAGGVWEAAGVSDLVRYGPRSWGGDIGIGHFAKTYEIYRYIVLQRAE